MPDTQTTEYSATQLVYNRKFKLSHAISIFVFGTLPLVRRVNGVIGVNRVTWESRVNRVNWETEVIGGEWSECYEYDDWEKWDTFGDWGELVE